MICTKTSFSLEEEFLDTSDSLVGCVLRFWTHPIFKSAVSYTPKYYCLNPGILCKLSIWIKFLDENNDIYGVDTSDLTIRCVQNLVIKLETRPLTEVLKSHIGTKNKRYKVTFESIYSF